MWLTSSSIGRKFVMAITGICLVLFVTFHVLMNAVAIVWPTAYNVICEFLGANWYALIASAGLAVLFILHIIYASWLTIQNRKARGNDRYLVTSRPPQVEWSSKNMYVLGIVVLAFLVVHLIQFWAKMQWQEIRGVEYSVNGVTYAPQFGTLFLQEAFTKVWTPIVYCIGFIALWFHMNHGFWSMFHTVGWDNNKWIERLKGIGFWWTTVVIALFCVQIIVFTVQAKNNHYLTDPKLQEQYAEHLGNVAEEALNDFQADQIKLSRDAQIDPASAQQRFTEILGNTVDRLDNVFKQVEALCPGATNPKLAQASEMMHQMQQYQMQMQYQLQQSQPVVDDDEAIEEITTEEKPDVE